MIRIFNFGLSFLNRLRFKQKFIVIFFVISIPIIALFTYTVFQLNKEISHSKKEQQGLLTLNDVSILIKNTQQHRGMSVRFLNGDEQVKETLTAKQAEITEGYENLNLLIVSDHLLNKQLVQLRNDWEKVQSNFYQYEALKSFNEHTNLIQKQMVFAGDIADTYRLSVDSDLENKYLITLLTDKLLKISEYLGEARAIGTGVATKGFKSEDDQLKLYFSQKTVTIYLEEINYLLEKVATSEGSNVGKLQATANATMKEINASLDVLSASFIDVKKIEIDSEMYFQNITKTINGIYEFMDDIGVLLDEKLAERITQLQFFRYMIILLTVVAGAISIYLFLAFYIGVQNNIKHVQKSTAKIAEGDLTQDIQISSKDEFRSIGESINKMVYSFREIVASNQEVAEEVSHSTNELSLVTEDTAKATEQITLAMEEIAKLVETQLRNVESSNDVLEELSSSLLKIANSSEKAANSSHVMATKAQRGNETVKATINQMNQIKTAVIQSEEIMERLNLRSTNISKIVDMITSIADQTNLLALNAAIEAARAGEAGKGFTVVAEEVRKLAENSAQSTSTIQQLIKETLNDTKLALSAMKSVSIETEAGIADVEETKVTFETISSATHEVANGINDVAILSKSMTGKLEQLTHALEVVGKLSIQAEGNTQQVAGATEEQLAAMEEISSTAINLNEKAKQLEAQIDRFNV